MLGWIPMRHHLSQTVEVRSLASLVDRDPLTIVGALQEIWSLADLEGHHTDRRRNIVLENVPRDLPDRVTGIAGFAQALEQIGWTTFEVRTDSYDGESPPCVTDPGDEPSPRDRQNNIRFSSYFGSICFQNMGKWVGKTAKERLRKAQNSRNYRARQRLSSRSCVTENGDGSVTLRSRSGDEPGDSPTPTPEVLDSSFEESSSSAKGRATRQKEAPIEWSAQLGRWNEIAEKAGLKRARTINDEKKKRLRAQFRRHGGHVAFWAVVEKACLELGSFAQEKGFVTLDFVSYDGRCTKLLDGNYSNHGGGATSARASAFNPKGKYGR